MRKMTGILVIIMLVLPAAFVFADDPSTNSDNSQMSQPPTLPTTMPASQPSVTAPMPAMPPMPGMMSSKTVVATSDGGIVIVEGNKVTKLDSNLSVVKSVELSDSSSSSSS